MCRYTVIYGYLLVVTECCGAETVKDYVVNPGELAAFESEYKTTDSWSKAGSFWVKAWVCDVSPQTKTANLIVADKRPDIVTSNAVMEKREPQADELEAPSRKDTVWGDLKRAATIAARDIQHLEEFGKLLPKPNLTIMFHISSLSESLEPGQAYWFRLHPRKASLFNHFRFLLVDAIKPESEPAPFQTFTEFRQERTKKRLLVFSAVAVAIIASYIYGFGGSVAARNPPTQQVSGGLQLGQDGEIVTGEKVTKYPSGEVHQRIEIKNRNPVKSLTFYKNGKLAQEIIYNARGHAKTTLYTQSGEAFVNGELDDPRYMSEMDELGRYMGRELNRK
jgi:hypothetical protein